MSLTTLKSCAVAIALFAGFCAAWAAEEISVAPDDLPALKAHVGQVVEIKGTVAGVGKSPTGNILFVNFAKKPHAGITGVFFTSGAKAGSVKTVEELQPFVGKNVSIKGELSAYKDDVQMVLQAVGDLHVIEAPGDARK